MANLKRAFRYLRGTLSLGIIYTKDAEEGGSLIAYADVDFAEDKDGGYSTTRAVIYLVGAPLD